MTMKVSEYLNSCVEVEDWVICAESKVLQALRGGACERLSQRDLEAVRGLLSNPEGAEISGLALAGRSWVLTQHSLLTPCVLLPKNVQHRKAFTLLIKPLPQGFIIAVFRASPQAAVCALERAMSG